MLHALKTNELYKTKTPKHGNTCTFNWSTPSQSPVIFFISISQHYMGTSRTSLHNLHPYKFLAQSGSINA